MTHGQVADGTNLRFRVTSDIDVRSFVDAWDEYFAEFEIWLIDNPAQAISDFEPIWETENGRGAPEFAAVTDRDNITDKESIFVEVRFFETHSNGDRQSALNASWCQVNDTLIPGIPIGFWTGLKKTFNARRTKVGGDTPI